MTSDTGTTYAFRLYDLLDVAPDATAEEIRAAWKSAIADLDPSDRRFRAYNQAAELLLDPDRRAAYDAQLAAVDAAEVEAEAEAEAAVPSGGFETVASATSSTSAVTPTPPLVEEGVLRPSRNPVTVSGWLLIGVALLTAVAVGVATWLFVGVPSDDTVADATREAQSAAERAVVPVLSYDADTLDEDQAEASSFLTTAYRRDYDQLFAVIRDNAPQVGTEISAEVVSSGIVRSGEDRVQVLIFVNRPTTNKQQQEPIVYRDQVTVTMVKAGDSWLIDDLITAPPAE